MSEFGTIIKSICILSGAIFLVEGLTSGTRFRTQMRFLLNLLFIIVIAAPVLKGTLSIELPELDEYKLPEFSDQQELYDDEVLRITAENIEAVLMQQLEAAGINCTGITAEINISETNSISISSVTVSADDFNAAAEVIRSSLGADTEVYNGDT